MRCAWAVCQTRVQTNAVKFFIVALSMIFKDRGLFYIYFCGLKCFFAGACALNLYRFCCDVSLRLAVDCTCAVIFNLKFRF